MQRVTCLAAALALVSAANVFANDLDNHVDPRDLQARKDAQVFGTPDPQPQVGGEDIATATVIPGIPYWDTGNTCGYVDDYEEICPYGSNSGDVVYQYTPGWDSIVDIRLCNSSYDTKTFVYENSADVLVACNDDACGPDGFRSELVGVPMYAGNTYYIVVDGYSGDCGEYDLHVTECPCCVVECPPGGWMEGEPPCGPDYVDTFNGGCHGDPPMFQPVPCSEDGAPVTICGTGGGYIHGGLDYRDTDWYEVRAENNPNGLVACLMAEYPSTFLIIVPDCDNPVIVESVYVPACVETCLPVPPQETFWIFVAVDGFGPEIGCGHDYTLTLSGYDCGPVPVESVSWGRIKERYR